VAVDSYALCYGFAVSIAISKSRLTRISSVMEGASRTSSSLDVRPSVMTARTLSNNVNRHPYVGLRPFRTEDADRFFGRATESHDVAALWQANRLTVVYGCSGVGKTSLLSAGVIPLLDPGSVEILPPGRVSHSSAFPLAALLELSVPLLADAALDAALDILAKIEEHAQLVARQLKSVQ